MAPNNALLEAIKNAKNKYSRSDNKHLKPKEGRNVYRIVPPSNPSALGPGGEFWHDLGVHWIKTSLTGKPIAVVGSRDVCFGEPDDVLLTYETALQHAEQAGYDEDTIKLIKEMRVQKSVLFWAIDRTTDPKSQKEEILEIRPSVAQQIFDLYQQYLEAGQDMFDLNAGIDIVVTRNGKGLNTEYSVNVKPGASAPVAKDVPGRLTSLREHVEKEFFKGDENKAIATIKNIAGIAMPALGSSRPTAALSQSKPAAPAQSENAFSKAAAAPVEEEPSNDLSTIADSDLDSILDDLNNI